MLNGSPSAKMDVRGNLLPFGKIEISVPPTITALIKSTAAPTFG